MDPEVSENVHAFYNFSIEGDCRHFLLRVHLRVCALLGLISDSASGHQCNCFQLLLGSGYCCVGVTGWFFFFFFFLVFKPVICKRKHPAYPTVVRIRQSICVHNIEGWGQGERFVEVTLSVVGAWRSSLRVA